MDGDVENVIAYLSAKQYADPSFFYKIDVDDENRLNRLFWSDSQSHRDYEIWFRNMGLNRMLRTFNCAIDRLRNGTPDAASRTENTSVVPSTYLTTIELYVAEEYTRNVFNIVRKQIRRQGLYFEKNVIANLEIVKYYLAEYEDLERTWTVEYNNNTENMECTCLKLESKGILCYRMLCHHSFTIHLPLLLTPLFLFTLTVTSSPSYFEPDAAYYDYEEAPNPETQRFCDMEYKAATNYILLNWDEVELYLSKYTTELRTRFPSLTESDVKTRISNGKTRECKQQRMPEMLIIEFKAYFVEAHPSFRKVPNRMKNMWYTGLGIQDEARDGTAESAVGHSGQGPRKHTGGFRSFIEWFGEDGQGLRTVRTVCPTASAEGTLKANAECLHIKTSSPILIAIDVRDCRWQQQRSCLWFRLTVCSHYCKVPRRQQQLVISSFGIFCNSPRSLYREGEEVVGIHVVGIGEVHQLHDIICISV
ncbi:hypothetical protein M9H77_31794 [Catharanthus roseus]|uniref:Uncharacterized protein n=1 Tax=Catharanthus roseus TaxID=4058 RepID=A0ACC0A2D0_CATRO|nr:hypothetical protein M9H77_31794 [Catharanthus roseus]